MVGSYINTNRIKIGKMLFYVKDWYKAFSAYCAVSTDKKGGFSFSVKLLVKTFND